MSNYKVSVQLTSSQMAKLKKAVKNKKSVSIRLSANQLKQGNNTISVPFKVLKRIDSAKKRNKGVQIKLEPEQIGGFLPALIPAAMAAGPALVAAGTSAAEFLGPIIATILAEEGIKAGVKSIDKAIKKGKKGKKK